MPDIVPFTQPNVPINQGIGLDGLRLACPQETCKIIKGCVPVAIFLFLIKTKTVA
jgi:hypothetical protein